MLRELFGYMTYFMDERLRSPSPRDEGIHFKSTRPRAWVQRLVRPFCVTQRRPADRQPTRDGIDSRIDRSPQLFGQIDRGRKSQQEQRASI